MSDNRTTTSGNPIDEQTTELKDNGQQKDYIILTEEERAKGFIRPVRTTYVHVGNKPKYPLRILTDIEHEKYDKYGYEAFEVYPESESPKTGRYWTKEQLANNGCGATTTMSMDISETYARDPKFYGATFCVTCGTHLPVEEFVWVGTEEKVGS